MLVDQHHVGRVLEVEAGVVACASRGIGGPRCRGSPGEQPVERSGWAARTAGSSRAAGPELVVAGRGRGGLLRGGVDRRDAVRAPHGRERCPAADQEVHGTAVYAVLLQKSARPRRGVSNGIDADAVHEHLARATAEPADRLDDVGSLGGTQIAARRVQERENDHLAASLLDRGPVAILIAEPEVSSRLVRRIEAARRRMRGGDAGRKEAAETAQAQAHQHDQHESAQRRAGTCPAACSGHSTLCSHSADTTGTAGSA